MSGYTGTLTELLYGLNSPITKNNWSAEAAFSGVAGTNSVCSLPAGYFAGEVPSPVGRPLYLVAMGTIANASSATFASALGIDVTPGTKANPTVMHTAYTPTAGVIAPFRIEAWLLCTAFATNTISLQVNGYAQYESIASGGGPTTGRQTVGFSNLLTGIDPRVQLYLELFGTWSAAAAANQTVLQQMMLFGLD